MKLKCFALKITVVLFFACIPIYIQAQPWQQNDLVFNPSGIPSLPFSQPRFADLDADGDLDMILSSLDDKPFYFENTGSALNPAFRQNDNVFIDVTSLDAEVGVCADIDNDGDLDFIAGGYNGLTLFENLGDLYNPFFEKGTDLFGSLSVGENPCPALADVDADGDLDLVAGLSESGVLKLYLNSGRADSAAFSEDQAQQLADVGLFAYPYFCDPDGDHDFDILTGRDGHGFYYYKNTGDSAQFSWQLDNAPFGGLATETYWNSPCVADLNGDGKADIIYGTSSGPLHYYENSGSISSPGWTENLTLFGGVLDVGGASSPFFIDFDRDGDLDLVSGSNLGGIKYYKNTGNMAGSAWQESNSYFSTVKHSIYSAITLADLTGDSLADVVAGDLNGGLYFHRNTGSGFKYESTVFSGIDLGNWSAPKLVDMDYDDDFDIVAGNEAGNLFFFENSGRADSSAWNEIPGFFNGLDVGSNAVPALADVDGDGDCDLVTGNISGTVQYFENVNGTWTEKPERVAGVSGGQNTTPVFADLDGDGDPDLILGNYSGTFNYFENQGVTFIENNGLAVAPQHFSLESVYPNPFNSTVVFKGNMPAVSSLRLNIFNLLGQHVLTKDFFNQQGRFQLQVTFPQNLPSGVYLYNLNAQTQKIGFGYQGKLIYLK